MYVPYLFISGHSHSTLSHAIYPAKLVESHSRDEVSKQTDMKLMKILIFQEVSEPPISKNAFLGLCVFWVRGAVLFVLY